jgi:hypothetical protein
MRIPLLLLVACLASPLVTFAKDCTSEEGMAAEDIAARLTDWKQIYSAFERFSHCDDGAIAEGFTDSVVRLLATHWETLPQVASLENNPPAFRTFILRHINDTADTSDLKRVAHLARTNAQRDMVCCAPPFLKQPGETHIPPS